MSHENLSPGEAAYHQAQKEVPHKWVEPDNGSLIPTIGTAGLLSAAGLAEIGNIFPPSVPTLIASGVLYSASAIADYKSTISLYRAMKRAQEEGIPGYHREASPFMRGATTPEEIKKNKMFKIVNVLGAAVIPVIPVSVGISTGRLRASLWNMRTRAVYNRAIAIHKRSTS